MNVLDLANLVNRAAIKASTRGSANVTAALLDEAKDDIMMGVVRKVRKAVHLFSKRVLSKRVLRSTNSTHRTLFVILLDCCCSYEARGIACYRLS